ncbi:MAG TPA: sigma-70 family RNA polymerase sigma factor [Lacunisphaera sp.]|nr:sigma-70 family RNA polymerase sigma factor [Lacunisphaera sp.]
MVTDAELLQAYARQESEAAFGELVRRQVRLVYSVALRQCGGDAHLAEDVTQRVFTDLARRAGSLSDYSVLGGWLYRRAQFVASDIVRADHRRRRREQEAHAMQATSLPAVGEAEWQKLAPVLHLAISELPERDRDAVILRCIEARPFREVGAMLSLTEDAARMRVERALEKLRAALGRRGITSTAAALGLALANQATAAVPASVAASATGAALAAAGSAGIGAAWLAIFTMNNLKTGVVGALLLAGLATVAVEVQSNRGLRAEMRALQAVPLDPGSLARERERLRTAVEKLGASNPEAAELARLRQRASALRARPPGVLDEQMVVAANWRDVGRATPQAANMTFHRAMFTRDLDTVAGFVIFDDDTPENREAFMAHFSPAVRAKYRTPERIMAAAAYGAGTNAAQSPDDAFQFLAVDDHVGGNGSRFGQKRVRVWYRLASGREFEGSTRWQETPGGWLPAAFTLAREWKYAVPAFDPATGDRLPPPKPGESPLAK